jgi:hypothetical protein
VELENDRDVWYVHFYPANEKRQAIWCAAIEVFDRQPGLLMLRDVRARRKDSAGKLHTIRESDVRTWGLPYQTFPEDRPDWWDLGIDPTP